MNFLFNIAVIFLITCCVSKPEVKEPLKAKEDIDRILVGKGSEVKPKTVLDWTKQFKPKPSAEQRSILEKKVSIPVTSSTNPNDILQRARDYSTLGFTAEAESHYKEFLRLFPDNLKALVEFTFLTIRSGDVATSFELLAQIEVGLKHLENPGDEILLQRDYGYALAHLKNRDFNKAHSMLSQIIGTHKDFSPAYSVLSASYINENKMQMAEFVARRGIDQGRPDSSLYNILGIIEMQRGRNHYARDYFKKSLEVSATFVPAMVNRALIAMAEMDLTLAEEDLKNAVQIEPQNVDGLLNLGILMRQTGRFQDAKRHLERAQGLEPQNSFVRYHLGVLYAENFKKSDEAIRLMSEVVQLSQDNKKLRSDAQNYLSVLRERKN